MLVRHAFGRLAQRESIGLTSGTGPPSPDSGCCPLLPHSRRRSASQLAICVSGRVSARVTGAARCTGVAARSRTVLAQSVKHGSSASAPQDGYADRGHEPNRDEGRKNEQASPQAPCVYQVLRESDRPREKHERLVLERWPILRAPRVDPDPIHNQELQAEGPDLRYIGRRLAAEVNLKGSVSSQQPGPRDETNARTHQPRPSMAVRHAVKPRTWQVHRRRRYLTPVQLKEHRPMTPMAAESPCSDAGFSAPVRAMCEA